jgi:hypothetical protein
MTLTKNDILKQKKLKTEIVDIPEWGGSIIVQEMTAAQRDSFEAWTLSQGEGNTKGMRVAILIHTVVDENGKQIFTDLDMPDLAKKSGVIIDKIAAVGLRLNGMTEEAVEEEVKN